MPDAPTTREVLEALWQAPGCRAPGHVAGTLPIDELPSSARLEPELDHDKPLPLLPTAVLPPPAPRPCASGFVTVRGAVRKPSPVPKIEWPKE